MIYAAPIPAALHCPNSTAIPTRSGGTQVAHRLAQILGGLALARRTFLCWHRRCHQWRIVARRGFFGAFRRWRRLARRQRLARRHIHTQQLRRCWVQWLEVHRRRRLLVRVLARRERLWEARGLHLPRLVREFRALEGWVLRWREAAAMAREEREGLRREACAQLSYAASLSRKVFSAWAVVAAATERSYGPPAWSAQGLVELV